MSLKMLHVVFVTASVLLAGGFSAWSFNNYLAIEGGGARLDLTCGILSALAGLGLLVYGNYFLRKLKKISYL